MLKIKITLNNRLHYLYQRLHFLHFTENRQTRVLKRVIISSNGIQNIANGKHD